LSSSEDLNLVNSWFKELFARSPFTKNRPAPMNCLLQSDLLDLTLQHGTNKLQLDGKRRRALQWRAQYGALPCSYSCTTWTQVAII